MRAMYNSCLKGLIICYYQVLSNYFKFSALRFAKTILQLEERGCNSRHYFIYQVEKLTFRVNFTNVLTHSFYAGRSQKCKKLLDLKAFFSLLVSARVKAVHKTLMKLTSRMGPSKLLLHASTLFHVTPQKACDFLHLCQYDPAATKKTRD